MTSQIELIVFTEVLREVFVCLLKMEICESHTTPILIYITVMNPLIMPANIYRITAHT